MDGAAAQHVARVDELHAEVGGDGKLQVVGDAGEVAHGLDGVAHVVDGFHGFQALFGAFLVELDGIGFLDAARVGQHDAAEVAGGGGAEDGAAESHLDDVGNQSRVVDVGVREQDVVDVFRIESEVAVHAVGFQTFPLVHSAVQQYFGSFYGGQEEFAAGHFGGGP